MDLLAAKSAVGRWFRPVQHLAFALVVAALALMIFSLTQRPLQGRGVGEPAAKLSDASGAAMFGLTADHRGLSTGLAG